MKDITLLNQIQSLGITLEQSVKALHIVTDVAKQKFPLLEGSINSFLKKELMLAESEQKANPISEEV